MNKMVLRKYTPSHNTQRFINKEKRNACWNYDPIKVVVARAKGAYVWDVDNKKYLDCVSGYSVVNQGHVHPKIKEAIIEQMNKVTITSRAVFNDQLGSATEYLNTVFGYDKSIMTNGGVETGETSVKFARRWAYMKKGIPENHAWVLFAQGNFWGRTIAACGSSDDPYRYDKFGPFEGLKFGIIPYNDLNALEHEFKTNPNIAAYRMEPIQGEGGVIVPDKGYLKGVRDLCTKYNVLLIMDEVQTGLGRTGKLVCQDHDDVKADLLCLGKALSGGFMPISAVLGSEEIFSCITPGTHGSTFGGNPLAGVTAKASIQVLFDEGMIDNSAKLGKRLMDHLTDELKGNRLVTDVRGKGLFIGVEIDKEADVSCYKLVYELLDHGLLCKQTRENVLRLAPALVINEAEADLIGSTIAKTINKYK